MKQGDYWFISYKPAFTAGTIDHGSRLSEWFDNPDVKALVVEYYDGTVHRTERHERPR